MSKGKWIVQFTRGFGVDEEKKFISKKKAEEFLKKIKKKYPKAIGFIGQIIGRIWEP